MSSQEIDRYHYHAEWSEDYGEFIATVLEFPGVTAFGHSEQFATYLAKGKVALVIQTLRDGNSDIPEPMRFEFCGC